MRRGKAITRRSFREADDRGIGDGWPVPFHFALDHPVHCPHKKRGVEGLRKIGIHDEDEVIGNVESETEKDPHVTTAGPGEKFQDPGEGTDAEFLENQQDLFVEDLNAW